MQNRGNMRRIKAAQEATRQKKLRDTPVPVKSGKTTAAQYSAAYGTAPGANEKLKPINKRGYMVSKKRAAGVLSNKSASVVPDDKTAKSIKAKRKKGTVYAAARFKKVKSKKTGKLGSDVVKNPEEFEAEYKASGTGKAGDTFEAMKTPSKKRKLPQSLRSAGKTGKRRARAKDRERAIEKKPKTKKTKKTNKTKEQKELEAAYGSPKDTDRMMKGENLKESWGSKLKKKFGKGK